MTAKKNRSSIRSQAERLLARKDAWTPNSVLARELGVHIRSVSASLAPAVDAGTVQRRYIGKQSVLVWRLAPPKLKSATERDWPPMWRCQFFDDRKPGAR